LSSNDDYDENFEEETSGCYEVDKAKDKELLN